MQPTRKEIITLEYQLIEAIKSNDINFIRAVLHDHLLFLAPNGQVVTKEADLASHMSQQMIVKKLIPHFEDLKIIGNIAVSIVVYETEGTMLGKPISGFFRYIRTWKAFTDGIRIIRGACFRVSQTH